MTGSPRKSVFALDPDTQTYTPAVHNMNAAQAVERASTQSASKIVDQERRHRNPDPLKCKTCKKVAEELTAKQAEGAGSNGEEKALTAQESESD